MTEPNESQAALLRQNGWRRVQGLQYSYNCRVCHKPCGGLSCWHSPNYAFYHPGCVLESPQVKRLLRQAERSER